MFSDVLRLAIFWNQVYSGGTEDWNYIDTPENTSSPSTTVSGNDSSLLDTCNIIEYWLMVL